MASRKAVTLPRPVTLTFDDMALLCHDDGPPHTVKRHVAKILAKLHQRSRGEAVLHAVRVGVLASQAS